MLATDYFGIAREATYTGTPLPVSFRDSVVVVRYGGSPGIVVRMPRCDLFGELHEGFEVTIVAAAVDGLGGFEDVTVQDSSGATITVVTGYKSKKVALVQAGTAAGVWSASANRDFAEKKATSRQRETVVLGGLDGVGAASDTVHRYDGQLQVWITEPSLLLARSGAASFAISGYDTAGAQGSQGTEKVVVCGGLDGTSTLTDTVESIEAGVRKGELAIPNATRWSAGAEVSGSAGIVAPGIGSTTGTSQFTDAAGYFGTWSAKASTPVAFGSTMGGANRRGAEASRVLVTGQESPDSVSGQATLRYEPGSDQWVADIPDWPAGIPTWSSGTTWSDLDQRPGVLVTGGLFDTTGVAYESDQAWRCYEAGQASFGWKELPSMPVGRYHHGTSWQEGARRAFVVGGYISPGGLSDFVVSIGEDWAWRASETAMPVLREEASVTEYAPW